ncbi:MAG: hypothetical protein WB755_15875, partial [Terriglobales bacterium]
GLLIDSHHRAIGHCGCGAQADRLPCKATFSEEIALVQNTYGGFLPARRHNGESYLSFLYVKNSIRRVTLNKDRLLFGKSCDLSTAVHGRKECLGIEFAEFLGRYHGCHDWPLSQSFEYSRKATSYDVWMNKCGKKGANHIKLTGKTAIRSTTMMISPLVSKVNPSHLADFGARHWYCEMSTQEFYASDWELP